MTPRILMTTLIFAMCASVTPAQADDGCDAILRNGIANKFRLDKAHREATSFADYMNLSSNEFQERYSKDIKEGNASADVFFVWEASGGVKFEKQRYDKLIQSMKDEQRRTGAVNLSTHMNLATDTIDPVIVEAWLECKRLHAPLALGLLFETREFDNGLAVVTATWRADRDGLPNQVGVTGFELANAEHVGEPQKIIKASPTSFGFRLIDPNMSGLVIIHTNQGDYVGSLRSSSLSDGEEIRRELQRMRSEMATLKRENAALREKIGAILHYERRSHTNLAAFLERFFHVHDPGSNYDRDYAKQERGYAEGLEKLRE